jgi:hypothetical protein
MNFDDLESLLSIDSNQFEELKQTFWLSSGDKREETFLKYLFQQRHITEQEYQLITTYFDVTVRRIFVSGGFDYSTTTIQDYANIASGHFTGCVQEIVQPIERDRTYPYMEADPEKNEPWWDRLAIDEPSYSPSPPLSSNEDESWMYWSPTISENPTIHFVHHNRWRKPRERGSSIMRAFVPAHHLNSKLRVKTTCGPRLDSAKVKEGDVVYFIKCYGHPDVPMAAKKKCIRILDPIDDFMAKAGSNTGKQFNFFVASCESHAKWLCKKLKVSCKRLLIIDHLSTNIKNFKAWDRWHPDASLNVGIIQGINLGYPSLETIEDFCQKQGANFIFHNISSKPMKFCEETGNEPLYSYYRDIHIGLALYNKEKLLNRFELKPSTKLSAFASYGIPAVFTEQLSFRPHLEKHKLLNSLMVQDWDEATEKIKQLIKDREFYDECRAMMIELGKDFHMDRAKELYVDQLLEVIKNQ